MSQFSDAVIPLIVRRNPFVITEVMREYDCSASEAQHYFDSANDKAILFSSGKCYIPHSWGK